MAELYIYTGRSDEVQQVTTVTVGGTISGEEFTISAKHPSGAWSKAVEIASHTDSDGSASSAATALAAAWNASNHPYAAGVNGIGGAIAEASSGTITFTARTAGVPFLLSLNTPGGSATFTLSTTTANSGPKDMSVPGNWNLGSIPGSGDRAHITGNHDILYGAGSAAALSEIRFEDFGGRFFTPDAFPIFVLDSNAEAVFNCSGLVSIGLTNATPNITVDVYKTHATGMYLCATNSAINNGIETLRVHSGHVRIIPSPEDLTYFSVIVNAYVSGGAILTVPRNQVIANCHIANGTVFYDGDSITEVTLLEGQLTTNGSCSITTATINGGAFISNSTGTITTLNANGGYIDFTKSRQARTVTTVNQDQACTIDFDDDFVTFTTHNKTGPMRIHGLSNTPPTQRRR